MCCTALTSVSAIACATRYHEENLPFVDKSLKFLLSCANTVGSHDDLPCFTEAFMEQYPPGADWVDWQATRAYGSTTNFQTWCVRARERGCGVEGVVYVKNFDLSFVPLVIISIAPFTVSAFLRNAHTESFYQITHT